MLAVAQTCAAGAAALVADPELDICFEVASRE